ncbi:hypothetical protein PYCCODRAFT_859196 [Trametes coccinea BRFM310]|uniref:Uncharacterized protein n=1 Tax=Trametes coccinea (strain BRFM310) TaxID=1353009 RepID=A0A1Y2IDU6_TRAC3|nr:hypothetical protein PYCCODRAFT_859196 [Trametes coccinea BRFM310]
MMLRLCERAWKAYSVTVVGADTACMAPVPDYSVLPDDSIAHGYFRALLRLPRTVLSGNAHHEPKLRTSLREYDLYPVAGPSKRDAPPCRDYLRRQLGLRSFAYALLGFIMAHNVVWPCRSLVVRSGTN